VALSALLWLLTAAAWYRKVAEVDPVTVDPYGRTVALVRVGDTVVKEGLIRQGPASVFARCCDRAICQRWERLEDKAREVRRGL
jgi:endonuclease YncB( thermonuclease family)